MINHCPACNDQELTAFYAVDDIPAHSVLLMNTSEQAVQFPRGDLELCICRNCEFVFNRKFDVGLNEYQTEYEETQHFSPTFSKFADGLCQRLIEEYSISDKTVLEIGCGKGEFLAELCQQGDNRGIGIDPSCAPERLTDQQRGHCRFEKRLFEPGEGDFDADLICCRHTLEHIGPVRAFVEGIRNSIKPENDPLVFFELPALEIVLNECRFWDVYYEHCSYFSAASLCRLFENSGFRVESIETVYAGQYLLLFARKKAIEQKSANPQSVGNQQLPVGIDKVNSFREQVEAKKDRWRSLILESDSNGRPIGLWGAGSKCVSLLTSLDIHHGYSNVVVVDINPHKANRFLPGTGHRVIGPNQLLELHAKRIPEKFVVMNPVYHHEVEKFLSAHSIQSEVISLS